MTNTERTILEEVVAHPEGLLSPAQLINGIAKQDRRSVESLVVHGYLEEVPQDVPDMFGKHSLNFYRATEKAFLLFSPIKKRVWFYLKGDLRTIVVSVITALLTTLTIMIVDKLFH